MAHSLIPMASKFDKALPGFNTNLRHEGKIYHVQTEDSGKARPHIITHVFVEGNIVATQKESYEAYLGREDVNEIVKDLMKKQHKEMADRITSGMLDAQGGFSVEVEMEEAEDDKTGPPERPPVKPVQGKKQKPPRRRGRRTSGIYKKIFRREPTPIPFVPSDSVRQRMAEAEKRSNNEKRVYMAGQEVDSKDEQETSSEEKRDKTLEEIIADFLSDKLTE